MGEQGLGMSNSEEAVLARLGDLGQEASPAMARWLAELLLADETVIDARAWKEELLAFTAMRIIHLRLKDRGEKVSSYRSVFLRGVASVEYHFDDCLRIYAGGDQDRIEVGQFAHFGRISAFVRELIGVIRDAGPASRSE
jgi:hypothetical protein